MSRKAIDTHFCDMEKPFVKCLDFVSIFVSFTLWTLAESLSVNEPIKIFDVFFVETVNKVCFLS